MANDLFKQRLVGDGFEAVADDILLGQRYFRAALMDGLLDKLAPNLDALLNDALIVLPGTADAAASSVYAYAIRSGAAYVAQGNANNHVTITPGVLLQRAASSDGLEDRLLMFAFDGSTQLPIANGDASNPRVDLIQMSLAYVEGDPTSQPFDNATPPAVNLITGTQNTTRRVVASVNIKQGVAASSPAYPSPDPGYVAVGGVVVGANYNASAPFVLGADSSGSVAVLHDLRIPIGAPTAHTVTAKNLDAEPTNQWTSLVGLIEHTATGTASTVGAVVPVGKLGRLLGVSVMAHIPTALTSRVGSYTIGASDSGTALDKASNSILPGPMGGFSGFTGSDNIPYTTGITNYQGNHAPLHGPTIQSPAFGGSGIGPPLWSNGLRCIVPSSNQVMHGLAVVLGIPNTTDTVLGPVVFLIAEGL